jgi:hypothetical protein
MIEYETNNQEKSCSECIFRNFDTFHDEIWCSHNPLPEYVWNRSTIESNGVCGYWEEFVPTPAKNLITICCVCKYIRIGDEWHKTKEISKDITISHGYCPECAAKLEETIKAKFTK